MSDQRAADTPDDKDVEQLLRRAGPRQAAPAAMKARVHDQVRQAFEAMPPAPAGDAPALDVPRTQPWLRARWAAAASLVAALAGLLVLGSLQAPELPWIGQIEHATGGYSLSDNGPATESLVAGATLRTTTEGRLTLQLNGGARLRLDQNSELRVDNALQVRLARGRIYVAAGAGAQITVHAGNKRIEDIGTVFAVASDADTLTVATRDGVVAVHVNDQTYYSQAEGGVGEQLVIEGDALKSRQPIVFDDPQWGWIHQAVPAFRMDGATYDAYLQWAARETGRQLRYASAAVALFARQAQFAGQGETDASRPTVEQTLRATELALSDSAAHEYLVDFRR